jgi:hypothetical protein
VYERLHILLCSPLRISACSALTAPFNAEHAEIRKGRREELPLAGAIDDSEESSYGNSGWTFGAVRLCFVTPRCSGDIEVSPGDPISKLFEERGGGYRSRFAAADVLDVGYV